MNLPISSRLVPKMGSIRCRYCGSDDVRLSRTLAGKSLLSIYRCRACGRHFREGLNLRTLMPYFFAFLTVVVLVLLLASAMYFGISHDDRSGTALPGQQSTTGR